jgi:1-acyl-sn-glycerol-3-phosphate acyltransferase
LKLRWRVAWVLLYPIAKATLGIRVTGRRKLVAGPQILAVNHVSNFDPLLVGFAAAREVHFLAKEELFAASRLFAWLIRTWNAWPVRRGGGDAGAIKRLSWLLKRRQTVVLFPEGTRSRTGELARFHSGIGLLAVANQVPVVPVHMSGVARSIVSYWTDRDFVRRGLRRRPAGPVPIHVAFGDPVYPGGFSRDRAGYAELARVVEERVRALAGTSRNLRSPISDCRLPRQGSEGR